MGVSRQGVAIGFSGWWRRVVARWRAASDRPVPQSEHWERLITPEPGSGGGRHRRPE